MSKTHLVVIVLLGVRLVPALFAGDINDGEKTATQLFKVTPRSPAEKFFLVEEYKSPIDPTNPN